MTLGQRLRERRKLKGLSAGEVARRLGVSLPFYSDMERDRRSSAKYLLRLANMLGADVTELAALADKLPTEIASWLIRHPDAMRGILHRMQFMTADELTEAVRAAAPTNRRA